MSLDGFIARPDDSPGPIHDWYFHGDTINRHNPFFTTFGRSDVVLDDTFETTGAVAGGRRTDDLTGAWGGNHPLLGPPVLVLTHTVPDPAAVPAGPISFTFVTDGVASAVAQARAAAGDKNVAVMGGASTIQQGLRAGLLDEIQIYLTPVLIGEGIRLFEQSDTGQRPLAGTSVIAASGVTHLRYRVIK